MPHKLQPKGAFPSFKTSNWLRTGAISTPIFSGRASFLAPKKIAIEPPETCRAVRSSVSLQFAANNEATFSIRRNLVFVGALEFSGARRRSSAAKEHENAGDSWSATVDRTGSPPTRPNPPQMLVAWECSSRPHMACATSGNSASIHCDSLIRIHSPTETTTI